MSSRILPVIKKKHHLLVTLVLCNAGAMEALPVVLDNLVSELIAVILSVTAVLAFGEIIPQALCSRYGLTIGGHCVWFVRILMFITWPLSFPISKVLDFVLGENKEIYFRKAQLKDLVKLSFESQTTREILAATQEDELLTEHEFKIIQGALALKETSVTKKMTQIDDVFMLDSKRKLDQATMKEIKEHGNSRVPVYREKRENIIGIILVKNLIEIDINNPPAIENLQILKAPCIQKEKMMYDVLRLMVDNTQKQNYSHLAFIVKENGSNKEGEIDLETSDIQVLGIITLEDVVEALIQQEIWDETDQLLHKLRHLKKEFAPPVTINENNFELQTNESDEKPVSDKVSLLA